MEEEPKEKKTWKRGKKAGKDIKKMVVKASNDQIIENIIKFSERVQLLADLARGVLVEKVDKEGNERVYREKPDVKALQQLNEMQIGKPQMTSKLNMPQDHVPVLGLPQKKVTKD